MSNDRFRIPYICIEKTFRIMILLAKTENEHSGISCRSETKVGLID